MVQPQVFDAASSVDPRARSAGARAAEAPASARVDQRLESAGAAIRSDRTLDRHAAESFGNLRPTDFLATRHRTDSLGTQSGVATPVVRRGQPEAGTQARRSSFAALSKRYIAALAGLDAVAGLVSVAAVSAIAPQAGPQMSLLLVLTATVGWPLAVAASRGYERKHIGVGSEEMRAVFRAAVLALAVGAVVSALAGNYTAVAIGVISSPITVLISLLVRFVARKRLHHQQRGGEHVRRVVVVGSTLAAAELAAAISREPQCGMQVIGACVPVVDSTSAVGAEFPVLGDLGQIPAIVQKHDADAVAVTGGDATRHSFLRELAWALEGVDVELLVHPGLIEVAGPRMHIRPYVGLPLLHVEQPNFSGWRRIIKRATDVVLTGLGIIAISPVLIGIALAIKVSDRGPVIFRQTRVGLDGSTFTMLKFRSMHTDAEARLAELRASNPHLGMMFKMENDPRITRVGRFLRRFSLDELPQLFNVLRGTMSLVGPRPPLQSEVDGYEDHARRRLLVTPGLTGLWQVSGRSLLSWEETVRLDLRYVENWSLTLDLLILWKTFFAVLTRRGAY